MAKDSPQSSSGDREDLGRLGAFIRSQRRLAELSQRELARLTDLSDPYVSQIERGLHEPSIRVLKSLAKALDVQAETLMSYVGVGGGGGGNKSSAPGVAEAIQADTELNDSQKTALLEVYKSFLSTEK